MRCDGVEVVVVDSMGVVGLDDGQHGRALVQRRDVCGLYVV